MRLAPMDWLHCVWWLTAEWNGGWRLARLARRGAAIEATCMYNGPMAALRMATCSGHATTVKTPMDHGDHINAENADGKRPLDLTRENGHLDFMDLLAANGRKWARGRCEQNLSLLAQDGSWLSCSSVAETNEPRETPSRGKDCR